MKLPHNWLAEFDDERCYVHLKKAVSTGERKVTIVYQPPFLKRINPITGAALGDEFMRLPPETNQALMDECVRRWEEK